MASAPEPLDIHMIAIGGTGMAPLACLLKQQGHRVRGSDGPLYPPMSTLLERAGIEPLLGFDPRHLEPEPDLVIIGNAVPRSNPEALAVEQRGIERLSMPEALWRFFLRGRRPLVVAGTHGKTTTSALLAHVYSRCGMAPGYLIGGAPLDLPGSFALSGSFAAGSGARFIVEGDEYNAAYFDRGPKFLHYRPETLIVTSLEYDHADLYPDHGAFLEAFRELVQGLPPSGRLIACVDTPEVRELVRAAPCPVVRYGMSGSGGAGEDLEPPGLDLWAERLEATARGTRFVLRDRRDRRDRRDPEAGEVAIELAIFGRHNVENALAAWAAARADGLSTGAVRAALGGFRGVKRRLELLGEPSGIAVVDDFAHHPTEVAASLAGLRARFPGRRLVVLFEPRSLTAGRSFLFDAYVDAFAAADLVLLAPIFHAGRLDPSIRLDREALAGELRSRGTTVELASSVEALFERSLELARPGDVLVTMSSGAFEGLPGRLLGAL